MNKEKIIVVLKASVILLVTVGVVFSAVIFVFPVSFLSLPVVCIVAALGLSLGFAWISEE